jgi:hypothetical protein
MTVADVRQALRDEGLEHIANMSSDAIFQPIADFCNQAENEIAAHTKLLSVINEAVRVSFRRQDDESVE